MSAPALHVEPLELAPGALLKLAAAHPERYPVLLDSAAEGALSRSTLLAALPRGAVWLDARGGVHVSGDLPALETRDFLGTLEVQWRVAAAGAAPRPAEHPFGGGWFVYLGYELALEIEPSLRAFWPRASLDDPRPVALALRVPAALLCDAEGRGYLVAEGGVSAAEKAGILADLADAARQPATPAARACRRPAGGITRGLPAARGPRAGIHPRR